MDIRVATADDADQVLSIYAPFIESSIVTFEIEVPSLSEMSHRISHVLEKWPWLVMQDGQKIAGYVYAHEYGSRKAYQWTVESSIYLAENYRGRGIGRKLYACLFSILQAQGFYQVVAGASLPNESSVALHESMGFIKVGTFKDVGFKMGRWVDVCRWQLELNTSAKDSKNPPEPPIWFERFSKLPDFADYLKTPVA